MPNKKYTRWDVKSLIDEIIITAKFGWEVGPKQLQEACLNIAKMGRSALSHRAERIAKKRLK